MLVLRFRDGSIKDALSGDGGLWQCTILGLRQRQYRICVHRVQHGLYELGRYNFHACSSSVFVRYEHLPYMHT